jgi:hypothetical protein
VSEVAAERRLCRLCAFEAVRYGMCAGHAEGYEEALRDVLEMFADGKSAEDVERAVRMCLAEPKL